MKKRICSLLVFLSVQFTYISPVNAYITYMPGPITYTLDAIYCIDNENVQLISSSINFYGIGYAVYDFYLPFNAIGVSFNYSAASDIDFTIEAEDKTHSFILKQNGIESDSVYTYMFPITERKGERVFKFSASSAVNIVSITFQKEKVQTSNSNMFLCNLSDNEAAIQSAVLLDRKASMLMVNGGRRYINVQNPQEISETFRGRIYLPSHTLARAFGYYIEDMPEYSYLLLRHENFEFCFNQNNSYKEILGKEKEQISNLVVYKNGNSYLPLRYFAEVLGKTVGYKDGIVAIDDKFSVDNILNNSEIFTYVKDKFVLFYPMQAGGKTYYVSQSANASDENSGSETEPFLTLAKAADIACAGDKVLIREGVYRETLSPKNNGTATAPIIFQAAEGEKVIISANEVVTGFTEEQNGIYTASVPWNLGDGRNQVFYDNISLVEARYPNCPSINMGEENVPLSPLWPVIGDLLSDPTDNLRVTSETLLNQEENNYWKGGYFVTMRGYNYTLNTARIESSKKGELRLTDHSINFWDDTQYNQWNYGFITGHINALDIPGEWILKDNVLYIIPPKDANISNLSVEVKRRQLVADLSQSKYIQLNGIKTIGGSMRLNDSEMCVLNNLSMNYINHYILSKDQHSGFIDDANVYDTNGAPSRGEVGIYIGGRDNIVINNCMDHAAGAAIYGVGLYTYIENNIISNCGYGGSYVAGINFNTEAWKPDNTPRGGHSIYANTIFNSGRSVLHHTRAAYHGLLPYLPEEIAFNDFHDGTLASLDVGITYEYYVLMGNEKLKTRYHNNYIYYTLPESNPFNFGIYHDGGVQNIDTYNNVVFTTKPNSAFSSYYSYIFTQTENNSYANCDVWNNSIIRNPVIGGKNALEFKHFPNEKPFYAGAMQKETKYLLNYNYINNPPNPLPKSDVYYAKNAVLSDGVTIIYNAVHFSANNQWIKFENVDFGEASNMICVNFIGDKFNTGDVLDVIIGESMENGRLYQIKLNVTAPYLNQINNYSREIGIFSGMHNVYLKMKDLKTAIIISITTDKYRINTDPLNSERIYGGRYTDFIEGNVEMPPKSRYTVPGDSINPMVNNTWPGTILIYKNVTFASSVNSFHARIAAPYPYYGQPIQVHIGSPLALPIAELETVETNNWSTYYQIDVPLNYPLEPGIYDLYLTFSGVSKTSNLYYFGFEYIP